MSTIKIFQPTRILSASSSVALIEWVTYSLESGARYLLIDLSSVSFMDSSGMGSLAVALKRVQEAGGMLALCSLNGQARMLLEIAGMDQIFPIYDNINAYQSAVLAETV
jgi:anti-sigma B factor antagonist